METNKMKHTQGEWRQVGDFCIHVIGKEICAMSDDTEESIANAKHIVKCVNMHDELVSELEEALKIIDKTSHEYLAIANKHASFTIGIRHQIIRKSKRLESILNRLKTL